MKNLVLCVIIVCTCFSSFGQALGPQVMNASGGSYKKGYYAIDWSIGELPLVDVLKPTENSYIITNGFLQAHTEFPSNVLVHNQFNPDEIRILPNPTRGRLEVNFLVSIEGTIKLSMFNAAGVALFRREVPIHGYGKFERIEMSQYPNSTYILYIELTDNNGFVNKKGVYKIAKIK
ncbi:MAG TPA: hypothetical protein VGD17_03455 [Chitinophagaceae bacterium]